MGQDIHNKIQSSERFVGDLGPRDHEPVRRFTAATPPEVER
jgi:hypothetical protein